VVIHLDLSRSRIPISPTTVITAIVAVALKLYTSDQPFALVTKHSADSEHITFDARNVVDEWTNENSPFIQWWNYIVYDSVRDITITIVYKYSRFSKIANRTAIAGVGLRVARGAETLAGASIEYPMSEVAHRENVQLELRDEKGELLFLHEFVDDKTSHLKGYFDSSLTDHGAPISYDLHLYRIYGVTVGNDTMEIDKTNDPKSCKLMSSVVHDASAEVEGYVNVEYQELFRFERTPRFRSYGGSSRGCILPSGAPAVEYPWFWVWVVLPGENGPEGDFMYIYGDGRFQDEPIVSPIFGSYSIIGFPNNSREVITAREVLLRHEQSLQIPLFRSASHGKFRRIYVEKDDWREFEDDYGKAKLPYHALFVTETDTFKAEVEVHIPASSYYRLPLMIERNGVPRMYSDFRAVAMDVHVRAWRRDTQSGEMVLTVDKQTNTLNVLEYAYEAPMNVDLDFVYQHGVSRISEAHQRWLAKQGSETHGQAVPHDATAQPIAVPTPQASTVQSTTPKSADKAEINDENAHLDEATRHAIEQQLATEEAKQQRIYLERKRQVEEQARLLLEKAKEEQRAGPAATGADSKWVNPSIHSEPVRNDDAVKAAREALERAKAAAQQARQTEEALRAAAAKSEEEIQRQQQEVLRQEQLRFEKEQAERIKQTQDLAAEIARKQFAEQQARQAYQLQQEEERMREFERQFEEKKKKLLQDLEDRERAMQDAFEAEWTKRREESLAARNAEQEKLEQENAGSDSSEAEATRPPNWREEWEARKKQLEEEEERLFQEQLKKVLEEFEKIRAKELADLEAKERSSQTMPQAQ